jgi:hypothetical protein
MIISISFTCRLLAVISLFLAFGSCKWRDLGEFVGIKPDKTRNVIVMVDLSSSPRVPDRHLFYKGVISKEIISNLGEKDKLTVIPIDRSSVTNAQEIFLADLSKEDFTPEMGSPLEIEKITKENLEKYKATMLPSFESAFDKAVAARTPLSNETDIFGALESARRYALSDRPNYVIMLSDMMNYTKVFSMEPSNKGFTREKLNDLIANAPKVSLKNYVFLVLTGDESGIDPSHFSAVQEFWTKYFDKNDARLYDYSSVSRSKVDDLIRSAPARE